MSPPLTFRPAAPFIVLRNHAWLAIAALLGVFAAGVLWPGLLTPAASLALLVGFAAIIAAIIWNEIVRRAARYTLTDTTATWESGVFRRLRVDIPLHRVQNTVLYRSLGERIFGLGTIGIATAATDGYEIVWSAIDRPAQVLAALRQAAGAGVGGLGGGGGGGGQAAMSGPVLQVKDPEVPVPSPQSLPVIGLAGGIGSGKSTVARIFGELGCLVIDSDQRARAALDRPEVRDQLVSWWGPEILGPDGGVDRSRVARIVFADPAQRHRLESLVHPLVRQDRAAMVAEAAGSPVPPRAVVIDAPLLFEAGLDQECDRIVFVDTPRDVRLARVRGTRGWDESELDRRERSQLPLAEKQARSTHVFANVGEPDALRPAAAALLDQVAPRRPGPQAR